MMNGNAGKQDIYKRDILRDYALASAELAAQFDRFEESGVISFSIIRGILGEAHSKGLLWQLKDSAHLLFGLDENTSAAGQSLDWSIGFLFHECLIILESSYQMQKYYPAAQDLVNNPEHRAGNPLSKNASLAEMQQGLRRLAGETQDSLALGIGRIRRLLESINRLMCAYLAGETRNRPLARLFHDREDLLRSVFKERYDELIGAVFGPEPERPLIEAARSLLESGHLIRAERAAQKALAQKPASAEAVKLLDKITRVRQ